METIRMSVSMISCPSCRTLLFSDTIICPACQHVLDAEKAALIGENDVTAKSRSEQIPCRNCGEANQIGLVRCWNCSSFLREDIQEAYYDMLRSQRQPTFSSPGTKREHDSRGGAPPRRNCTGRETMTSSFRNLTNSVPLRIPMVRE